MLARLKLKDLRALPGDDRLFHAIHPALHFKKGLSAAGALLPMNAPGARPPEPWLALGLSMLAPGLGQLYAGRPYRAAVWFLGTTTALAATLSWVASAVRVNPREGILWYALLLGFDYGSWLDAWLVSRRRRLRRRRRPALAAALSVLFPGLGHAYVLARRWPLRILLAAAFALPGLAIFAGTMLDATAIPGWPRWLAGWPWPLGMAAGAALSAAAIAHSYALAFRMNGHRTRLPRLTAGLWLLAAASWANAQLPWEALLKERLRSFRIPSSSMEPTLLVGDRLWARRARSFARGEIVVFTPPHQPQTDFIKRVVGLPGEKLAVRGTKVLINGKSIREPWARWTAAVHETPGRDIFGPVKIPADSYFLMGDNRDNSMDSRWFGTVPAASIFGRAYKRYWPFHRAAGLAPPAPDGGRRPARP